MDPAGEGQARRAARFGPFEVDLPGGELRKGGTRLRIQEQPLRLLEVLLRRAGDVVTREELREQLWPADTYVDFDHSLNTAVRKLRTALGDSAETPRYVETVARRGYRFAVPVEWIGDAVERPRARTHAARWALGALIATVAASALLYGLWRRPPEVRTLAIMPFTSSDPHAADLGEILAETLIERFSLSPDLRVAARSSSFRFAGKPFDAKSIGESLNVSAILTGNIARKGERLMLHVEMIDTADGIAVWARDYPIDETKLGALERYLGGDLALRLGVTDADQDRAVKSSPAYDLYLRGRYHWHKRGRDNLLKAVDYYERALKLDPEFALAWAGLSNAYGSLSAGTYIPGTEADFRRKSHDAVERALSLDPNLAEAYASRAAGKSTYDWDFAGAESDYRKAIALKPTWTAAHYWYSEHLSRMGRFAEARREIDIANQLEPFSIGTTSFLCWNRFVERRYGEGIAYARRMEEIDPRLSDSWCLESCLVMEGRYPEAVEVFRTKRPVVANELRAAFGTGGVEGFWRTRIKQRASSAYARAEAWAMLGDRERAFAELESAIARREPLAASMYVDPFFDSLRPDPRFDALARKVGLPQAKK